MTHAREVLPTPNDEIVRFVDRRDAGRMLAERLAPLAADNPVVVGIPRGGVPVAREVAGGLHAPLDVIVVRKLGVPGQPELGMGAVGEDGAKVINPDVVAIARVGPAAIAAAEERERAEVDRRARRFRQGRERVPLAGRTVIVVDDGMATGGTARAAVQVARAQGAAKVLLAVPVASVEAVSLAGDEADEVIALEIPARLWAVGEWYENFGQVADETVIDMLLHPGG